MPGTSLATKLSPSPTPMMTGGPRRAATILSGSAAESTPRAKAPVSRLTARAHSGFERNGLAGSFSVLLHLFDQMRDDFGVGLGNELVALRGQCAFQVKIIFDDAVVNHNDATGAVAVRVSVLFGWAAVRSPAGVADAEGAVKRMLAQNLFKISQLAWRAPQFERLASGMAHGDSRRVITAVFEAP